MVEQLEKVPTILFLKHKVDIPVPRRGGVGRLQCLRPGQSSTSVAKQNVSTPMVQFLDAPVLADILKLIDTQSPVEQALDGAKISQEGIQQRLVDRDLRYPQMAEQLVEVPTVLSLSSLQQQIAEQTVDIPGKGFFALLPVQ